MRRLAHTREPVQGEEGGRGGVTGAAAADSAPARRVAWRTASCRRRGQDPCRGGVARAARRSARRRWGPPAASPQRWWPPGPRSVSPGGWRRGGPKRRYRRRGGTRPGRRRPTAPPAALAESRVTAPSAGREDEQREGGGGVGVGRERRLAPRRSPLWTGCDVSARTATTAAGTSGSGWRGVWLGAGGSRDSARRRRCPQEATASCPYLGAVAPDKRATVTQAGQEDRTGRLAGLLDLMTSQLQPALDRIVVLKDQHVAHTNTLDQFSQI